MSEVPRSGDIDPALVHKRSADEALFARYTVSPAAGCLRLNPIHGWADRLRDAPPRRAALHLAETLRQAVILTAHLTRGVTPGTAFVMDRMSFRVAPGGAHGATGTTAVEVRDLASVSHGGRLSSLVAEVRFLEDDRTWLLGEGHLRTISEPVYRRIRGGRAHSDEFPSTPIPEGFTIAPDGAGASILRYDTVDPLFFDHPVDHVPGMLLIAAAFRVFFERNPAADGFRIDARFSDFLELSGTRAVHMRSAAAAGADDGSVLVEFGESSAPPAAVVSIYAPSMTVDVSTSEGVSASMRPA